MSALSKYKTYPEYKDSDSKWYSQIPNIWERVPLKYITSNFVKDGPHETPKFVDLGIPFLSVDGIQNNSLVFENCRYISNEDHARYSLKCKPSFGDILLGKAASVGKVALVDTNIEFNVWSPLAVITPKNSNFSKYLYYSLQSSNLQIQCDLYSNSNTQKNLGMGTIDNLHFLQPSDYEANQIAQFLDHETAKIDQLIEKQQTLIELLKEKRQAVISHAVTKGLDPNVKMKDSDVEWLGELPEHWEILPTKRFFNLVCEPAPNNNDYELLSVYTDIGVRPRKDLEQKGNKASTTDGYWIVKEHDLVVNKLLAWMGAIGYSAYNGVTSPAYDILRPSQNTNSEFYHYLFRTKQANAEFKRWSRGIMEMRLRLYFDELGNIFMPVPTLEEQNSIVAYMKAYEHKTELLIQKAEQQIELMKERRTALISAAVTGKIDVRDWQPEQ